MKVCLVGQKAVGWNLAQRKTLLELSDIQFGPGSLAIKMPDAGRGQMQVGNKQMIKIIFEFEQSWLLVFVLILRTPNHDKTLRVFEVVRLIGKGSGLPAILTKVVISKRLDSFLNGSGHSTDNHVTDLSLVEHFDQSMVEEPGVGPQANSVKVRRHLLQALLEEHFDFCCSVRVAGSQNSVPESPRASFEAKQGMIARASRLLGIVTDFGFLNFPAEQRQNGRIQIQNHAAGSPGHFVNRIAQRIVQPPQAFDLLSRQTLQEFSQSRTAWKVAQPQQGLKVSVVMQDSGVRNTLHPGNHRINDSQNQLGRMILTVAAFPANVVLQVSLQIQFSTKLLKKYHAAIVSQTRIFDGKTYFSDASEHTSISSLIVRLMKQVIPAPDYNCFPSAYGKFQVLKYAYSPLIQDQYSH